MQIIQNIFTYIIDMGASVMMPIIFTLLGLIMGAKFGEALRAGMTFGVGFLGLNTIIGLMSTTISPVATALVENLNFKLTAIDIGWATGSAIAWSTEAVPFVFIAVIVTNILMILLGWTKTMDVDIWNYWHVLFSASAILLVCGSDNILAWIFAIGQAMVLMGITFIIADYSQTDYAEVFGLEGISIPHCQTVSILLYTYPIDWLLNKIPGVKDIHWTSEGIAEKLGLLGEPIMMGFIIGGFLSALAQFTAPEVNVGTAIQQILIVGMNVAAVLVLIPRMVSLLMEGLMPISEMTQAFLEKRFPGKELYIGLDSAVATGHTFVISLGLIAIPIVLILAVVLPWNVVLPLGDLATLPFFAVPCVVASKGNLFRGIIEMIVICIVVLTIASLGSDIFTELVKTANIAVPEGSAQITCMVIGTQWITWVPFLLAKWICL